MTRILYVHNSADIYGASRSLVRLLGRLDRSRFYPLVVLPEDGPLKAQIEAQNCEVLVFPVLAVITREIFHSPLRLLRFALRFPFSVLAMRRLLKRQRIDLVHTNTGVILTPALATRLAGVRHVWHIRDWFQEFGGFWAWYAKYITCCSDWVVAVSEAIAGQFKDRRKVTVLHNGFDLAEFQIDQQQARTEFRRRFGLDEGDFVVGCVGRIKLVRKGQEVLVQAGAILREQGRRVRFLLVGATAPGAADHLDRLRQLIQEADLTDWFVFAGEVADTRPAYAAMDVFVLPSVQPEPFGGVVMEAMAMGVPVVATNLGGSVEQVAEGGTGFLIPPGDAGAMADRIGRLQDDPELRRRLGQAGPERIAHCFALADKVAALQALYGDLVGTDR